MRQAGQIVLFRFPQADLDQGKLRPALLLARVPGEHDDWLISMVSSQLRLLVPGFDEVVQESDADFSASGLKVTSLIRIGRLAVAEGKVLLGAIGQIASDRLRRINGRLAEWLTSSESVAGQGDGPTAKS